MLRVSVASCVLISAALLASSDAHAEIDAASRAKARDLTERAIEKVKAGDHEAAIDLYLRAYELSSEPVLLSNIGSAYQSLGRRERALRYFCRYLEAEPGGKLASFAREQAQSLSAELGQRMCEKQAEKPKPSPATNPAAGGTGASGDSPASPGGDGEEGSTEDGGEEGDGGKVVVEGTVSSSEPAAAKPLRITGLALTGLGVVGLGIGGYYGYVGKQASDRITNNKDAWTAEDLKQQQIGKDANTNMKYALIGGGSAIVLGTALYFLGRSIKPEQRDEVSLVPQVTPASSGFALIGSF